ncbi:hypothetical protein [Halegenticoccus soli]|uniref:hypothetical protein n=1 Tax=Halegenticoccus soli TaxID=1985678 RepID=UPI000C6E4E03|nr:hypothetical protein [Halegenticoccus soli]
MTIAVDVDDRFLDAVGEFADARMMDEEEALAVKAEQALLEIEHLVSGATEVAFSVDGRTIRHEPSDELRAFLGAQAAETGLGEDELLKLHVDLFARTFLDDDTVRPSNAPPK